SNSTRGQRAPSGKRRSAKVEEDTKTNLPWRRTSPMSTVAEQEAGVGHVIILSPEMREIVGPAPVIEKLADGFAFTEGPVWRPEGDLLFSDIPNSRIVRWAPGGVVATFRHPSGRSNGLTLNRQGRL